MGIGLDGTVRNLIGQDAEQLVKTRIRKWLDSRNLIVSYNDDKTRVRATRQLLDALRIGAGH